MSKISNYLQEHVRGEVTTEGRTLRHFSRDGSVLQIMPEMVVYPFDTNDVRKIVRFCWQLADKGHTLPITARGSGSSRTGAAIGKGVVISFEQHFSQILEVDTKQQLARLQPGVSLQHFQTAMHTHGVTLPLQPVTGEHGSLGGAVANGACGRSSLVHGSVASMVDALEVVLSNGEVIQTGRISKRELNKKQGLSGLEGDIYRTIDGLISDNQDIIDEMSEQRAPRSVAGYSIAAVKQKDGSFDLTPLLVGSQGTLGIITEMIVKTVPRVAGAELLVVVFPSVEQMHDTLDALRELTPSILEVVSREVLVSARAQNIKLDKLFVTEDGQLPAGVALLEFGDSSERARRKKAKQAQKLLSKAGLEPLRANDPADRALLWQVFNAAIISTTTTQQANTAALPTIEDTSIAHEEFEHYLSGVAALAAKHHLSLAVWGSAGESVYHVLPQLDMQKLVDRQKLFALQNEYYTMVLGLGGTIAASYGEGRLRVPLLSKQFSKEVITLLSAIKDAFDPHGIFNPGVKLNSDLKDVVGMLAKDNNSYQQDYISLL